MKTYLDALSNIMEIGTPSSDRTGTGTISTFGLTMRFDLAKGFPLVTTKKLFTKAIIHELLWFLSGDTNIRYLQENGVTIWDEWRQKWTVDRPWVLVDKRTFPHAPYNGDYSFAGVDAPAGSQDGKLCNAWRKMLERCYDPASHNYRFYGAKGVSVCPDWHDVRNFIRDVKRLPHWFYKEHDWNNFQLDKDYFGSNQYNADSCIWLPNEENVSSSPVGIRFPDGSEKWFLGLTEASGSLGLSRSSIHRFMTEGMPSLLKANNKKASGWQFLTEVPDGKLLRRSLIEDGELGPVYGAAWRRFGVVKGEDAPQEADQIRTLIDTIRKSPDSRRLIVSGWNPLDVPKMALPPCHTLWQVRILDGKVHLQLYQRSGDMFLGIPFNIASYAMLTHMIAHVTGYEPGHFIHTIGDAHIYSNHVDQVREQLGREPRELPALKIARPVAELDGFRYEDFIIEGYDPHPTIKAPIAV